MVGDKYPWKRFSDYTFHEKIVHLDLKGAPPSLFYFNELFKNFNLFNATGVLVEYEDMFPFMGSLGILKKEDSYTEDDINQFIKMADLYKLEIIPLIQTFGHMEFVLKHQEFSKLRELNTFTDVICPSQGASFQLIKLMIDQVVEMHPGAKRLHIGSDEVYHIGKCSLCSARLKTETVDEIFLDHVDKVVSYIRASYPELKILMWDDMLRHMPLELIKRYNFGKLVQLVVWNYRPDIYSNGLSRQIFNKYFDAFDNVWAASAFKGATGEKMEVTDISYHLTNNYEWLKVMHENDPHVNNENATPKVSGIVITGWQRYNHFKPLCELMPSGLPSLLACLVLLSNGQFTQNEHNALSQHITGSTGPDDYLRPILNPFDSYLHTVQIESGLNFTSHEIYTMVKENYNIILRFFKLNSDLYDNRMQAVGGLKAAFKSIRDKLLEQKRFVLSDDFNKYFKGITTSFEWSRTFIDPYVERIDHIVDLL